MRGGHVVLEDVVRLEGCAVPTMRFWIELGAYDQ
jgi:hypothetical protein